MCLDMCFCNRKEDSLILLLAGTSTGDVVVMEYSLASNRAKILSKVHLEVAILACKLVFISETELKALIGTTEGALYSYSFTKPKETQHSITEEDKTATEEKLKLPNTQLLISTLSSKTKLHQCGLNGLSTKPIADNKYLVFTGADDQSLAVCYWNTESDTIESVARIEEAHDSSVRVTKLVRTGKGFIGLSSGYDQRLIVWAINKEGGVEKVEELVHGVPDIAAIATHKNKDGSVAVYLAGDGLEVLNFQY
eukprot:TRINITY_DN9376_c0_g4_i1.p1 TRINITY_DN9376_c0_g4~~TRINITY_DN9376_c0_g4_i1.p1  ORF type:complete len:252 (+),score=36.80 TRINITY_DN9376_c0_g4_i1:196-951(+)